MTYTIIIDFTYETKFGTKLTGQIDEIDAYISDVIEEELL